jgi:hypothetical protein
MVVPGLSWYTRHFGHQHGGKDNYARSSLRTLEGLTSSFITCAFDNTRLKLTFVQVYQ